MKPVYSIPNWKVSASRCSWITSVSNAMISAELRGSYVLTFSIFERRVISKDTFQRFDDQILVMQKAEKATGFEQNVCIANIAGFRTMLSHCNGVCSPAVEPYNDKVWRMETDSVATVSQPWNLVIYFMSSVVNFLKNFVLQHITGKITPGCKLCSTNTETFLS